MTSKKLEQLDAFEEEFKEEDKNEKPNKEELIVTQRGDKYTQEEWKDKVFDLEDSPTREEVEGWKDKHGHIYFTSFDADIYVWRAVTRAEYKELSASDESIFDREEAYVDLCVLYPRNFKAADLTKGGAGIPTTLTEMIMQKSGFVAQSIPIKL